MNPLFSLQNIEKNYFDKLALDGLTFSISEGHYTGLIGNNGCGKTTTILILANILSYDGGEYFFKDTLVTSKYQSFKRQLGIVLSNPYYIEDFDVRTYWKFVARFQEIEDSGIDIRINDLLTLLEIDKPNLKIKQLSKGNQAKVSLGAALIHNPGTLLLDEPFVNLDINTTEKIVALLKSLKEKKTMLITSHNLNMVADLCDRFLIMDQGKIVLEVNKTDYPSVEMLKTAVKEQLSSSNKIENLSWLG